MIVGVVFLYVIWVLLAVVTVWVMLAATKGQDHDDEHQHLPH